VVNFVTCFSPASHIFAARIKGISSRSHILALKGKEKNLFLSKAKLITF